MIRTTLANWFFSDIMVDFDELKDQVAHIYGENMRLERVIEAKEMRMMSQADKIGKLESEKRQLQALLAIKSEGNK